MTSQERLEFTTDILTFSGEKLSPEAALQWLATEYVALEEALSCVFIAEDEDDRAQFQFLANDLTRLHDAAVTALKTREPVVLRCIGPNRAVDFEDHTRILGQVVAQAHLEEQADSPAGEGFRRLGELLVARLKAEVKLGEATAATVAEEEPATAQPATESASQEPHLEVARILRERVAPRLHLIGDITQTQTTIREGGRAILRNRLRS